MSEKWAFPLLCTFCDINKTLKQWAQFAEQRQREGFCPFNSNIKGEGYNGFSVWHKYKLAVGIDLMCFFQDLDSFIFLFEKDRSSLSSVSCVIC